MKLIVIMRSVLSAEGFFLTRQIDEQVLMLGTI
jgi:hypothetical protein